MPVPEHSSPRATRRHAALLLGLLLAALCALSALGERAPAQSARDELHGKIDELEAVQDRQAPIEAQIEGQNEQINGLIARESELRRRESAVEQELAAKQAELEEAAAVLNAKRAELQELHARLQRAITVLSDRLVEIYKSSQPDVLSVVLESASFDQVLSESEYLERIENADQALAARVRALRDQLRGVVELLRATHAKIKVARDQVAAHERELDSTRGEIEQQHSQLVAARRQRQATLASLQSREETLSEDLWKVTTPPGQSAALVNGRAVPPPGAPLVVRAVIEAANSIADTPYVWGGGHGSFEDSGYDCSGAVSYALHGGGLLGRPLDSGGLATWGSAGAGRWITVLAHPGHAYAVIAGLRWDTSGGAGPRWHTDMRPGSGYVARHHPGT
jgi:cell wall-associated NlpC family hydrolase